MPEEPTEKSPSPIEKGSGQVTGTSKPASPTSSSQTPPTGRRQALRDMARQMTDEEFKSPAVQKMLYDELERCEAERDELREYVKHFHEADKRAAVLEEKLRTSNAFETLSSVGMTVGGAIVGLAPLFWESSHLPNSYGTAALCIGLILISGSAVAKFIKQR